MMLARGKRYNGKPATFARFERAVTIVQAQGNRSVESAHSEDLQPADFRKLLVNELEIGPQIQIRIRRS